ncbi:unnamed protein product [Eruca vesicaria subsp. sativa]|uniref:RING-type E3 ubiquitin transferase n=1 Tax=Eruca vesicaria subsp. sativa TaxID=29727 RepID=A0ABC8L5G2_ERUVS|nr:unnamed protein product [Eruca vesicaria subsp. sativa]
MNSDEQNTMDWSEDDNISDSATNAMRGNVTLVAIVILFFIVMVVALFYLYDHWKLPGSRSHHIRSRNRRPTMVFFVPTNPSHTASRGLHPAILNSLPVVTFSSSSEDAATRRDLIDCAVCLSEFEEGESGRVLPRCNHAFHVECIDMWFHSHSTCPLCRTLVEPLGGNEVPVEEQVAIITIPPVPVSATEPGSTSGSGSSAMPLDVLGRNPAAIEVPRRNFTRMLSRDR